MQPLSASISPLAIQRNSLGQPVFAMQQQPAFGAGSSSETQAKQALARALHQYFSTIPALAGVKSEALLTAIQAGKPLPLPKGYEVAYGISTQGKLESPHPKLQSLWPAIASSVDSKAHQPVFMVLKTPQSDAALKEYIEKDLNRLYAHEVTNTKTKIVTNNVVLSNLIEQLISGHSDALPKAVKESLNGVLKNKLNDLYQVQLPGSKGDSRSQSAAQLPFRKQLLGVELANKVYAESQDIEWHSIALGLALGATGEPVINHFFKEGGTTASVIRTALMSGIDILGNILSVMGIVNENLKARDKKLSVETLFGPKGERKFLQLKGDAGPDIKQGIKTGVLGGMIGVLYNIPAGAILSMPQASLMERVIIGGTGGQGSAIAIPTTIMDSKKSFIESINELAKSGKIIIPPHLNAKEKKEFIERIAYKELNLRIGMASSIKAADPIPLVGFGSVLLAGEKLGIPRPYLQTAYMALAPVMHNFLRLVFTGVEKFFVIPPRMKKLEKLVHESQGKPFEEKQQKEMDKAFLSNHDSLLSKGLTSLGTTAAVGGIILAAEVLCFMGALRKPKPSQTPETQPAMSFVLQPNTLSGMTVTPQSMSSTTTLLRRPQLYSQFYGSNIGFVPPASFAQPL